MHHVLENHLLRAVIREQGAELISVRDQETGREYLWQADPAFWNRTSPVLFPVVGQYRDHQSVYEGQTYTMGQHGFARDMLFSLDSRTDSEIWFRLDANPESHALYPFDFTLYCGYCLEERSIQVLWKVVNTDSRPMYFSIGAHPAFNCAMEGWKLRFDTDAPLRVGILENGVLSNREKVLMLDNGEYPITPDLFDEDALIIEHDQIHNVSLIDPDGRRLVEVDFQAPLAGIWSPVGKAAPFVCIEPWYGRSDRADFCGRLEEREYGNCLEPDQVFERSYLMTFGS